MTIEQELRDKLRKISALFEGATTTGEREATAAAIDRLRKVLAAAEQVEPSTEMQFTNLDRWHRKLFLALCRRYGLKPYRYRRQRYSTITLRAPRSFLKHTQEPEYLEIQKALDEYLEEATERIIREEVFVDDEEAVEIVGSLGPGN
jgi:hypothetical protein